MKKSFITLSLALGAGLSACTKQEANEVQPAAAPVTNDVIASADELVYDMTGQHENRPHGVPDGYDWAQGPRIGMGNNPYLNGTPCKAYIAWGQVYEGISGNSASNVRIQIRGIRSYIRLKSTHTWTQVYNTSSIEGAQYKEDFSNNTNQPAGPRDETNNGGGLSVKTGGGYNYHFWPAGGRAEIDPNNIEAVFATFEARLIKDDPNGPDQRHTANFVASAGGDYWLDKNAGWQNFQTNGDCAIGKFKQVTATWRSFSMHTVSPASNIRNIAPPLDNGGGPIANGVYTLTPQCAPGTRLDISNGTMANFTDVRTWHDNGHPAQRWLVQRQDDGTYRLSSVINNNYVLDVNGGQAANRTEVQLYQWGGWNSQRWHVNPTLDGYFELVPKSSPGYALDVEAASSGPANVWLYQRYYNSAQKFRFTPQ